MGILEKISSPADLKALDEKQLTDLASEIRQFLVETVSYTHLTLPTILLV